MVREAADSRVCIHWATAKENYKMKERERGQVERERGEGQQREKVDYERCLHACCSFTCIV